MQPSALGGFGVFPAAGCKGQGGGALDWSDVSDVPVLFPYLGVETVVKDHHSLKILMSVLKGHFERLTLAELQAHRADGQAYVADGLFAVPQTKASQPRLLPETRLLQVASSPTDLASACYLVEDDVRANLHLDGSRAHLFDLLCAHARHEHAERHLATHVATVHRKEEGYVLVNAHPAFADPVGLTGMINEPASGTTASLKMTQAYARLLRDDDPLMRARVRLRHLERGLSLIHI